MQPVGPVTTVPLWLLVVIKVEPMTKVQMWVWMPMVQPHANMGRCITRQVMYGMKVMRSGEIGKLVHMQLPPRCNLKIIHIRRLKATLISFLGATQAVLTARDRYCDDSLHVCVKVARAYDE